MRQHVNYQKTGGREEFNRHYTARDDHALFDKELRERMVFTMQKLVSEGSFIH